MFRVLNRVLPRLNMGDQRLGRTSKLVYGGMRTHKKATIKGYADAFNISYHTVRNCIRELERHDWIYSFREPNYGHLVYVPWMPLDVEISLVPGVERRFDRGSNRGERLMKAMLDVTVDDDDYIENARLEWTASGANYHRLEFDRFYSRAKVAIEFQGRQHFQAVAFPDGMSNLQQQEVRDGLKALACLRQGVIFVEINDIELSYETIATKLRGLLPLIPPPRDRPLFRALENMCHSYTAWALNKREG